MSAKQAYILVSDPDLALLEAAFDRDHPLCATALTEPRPCRCV
jgi:hypothetical protein